MAVTTAPARKATMATQQVPKPGIRVSMRVKLLAAFAGAFTVVFAFIAWWVYDYAETNALNRLRTELTSTAVGGAATLDVEAFVQLINTVPIVPDPANPFGLGYPDDPLYLENSQSLADIHKIVPEAYPYTYFKEATDEKLYFAGSAGYYEQPQFGVTYRVPVADVVSPETYERMERGLMDVVEEPEYVDEFGSWISTYAPLRLADGTGVGAIGVDYQLSYVQEVRDGVRQQLIPALLISYLVLMGLVTLLSSALVRPLRRLTRAAGRIAEGEYDLDLEQITATRFPDEMYDLGHSFALMAEKVGARELTLANEVQRLKVEIDSTKRAEAVEEITGTDFFSDLSAKAAQMRARMREGPGAVSS